MKKLFSNAFWLGKIALGCALFALGFDLFLVPHELTAGGISGISMILAKVLGFGTVGGISLLINLPLFIIGGKKIGKRFFVGSLFGTLFLSVFIDLFTVFSTPETEPLLGALYGGILCGLGLGIVFMAQASTGGSDIVVRLVKRKYRNLPIGKISMGFDFAVAALTGLVFRDVSKMLYSLITIYVTGLVIDGVIYKFDYSKVAFIVSSRYEEVAKAISTQLDRGVTYLYGQGYYSQKDTKVVLTAVKKNQLSELKELVVRVDPDAFIIVQEAHQVLGDGFARYDENSL